MKRVILFLFSISVFQLFSVSAAEEAKLPGRPLTWRENLWAGLETSPGQVFAVDKAVNVFRNLHARYEAVRDMKAPGCPAAVICAFHMRESDWNFRRHLHDGSSLNARTKGVPKGRPATGNPPFRWEVSAYDALYVIKSYDRPTKWASIDSMVDWIERYNGLGYRVRGLPSPYLVGGSNQQTPGKFVDDGVFSRTAWDHQLGCLTFLKALADAGLWQPPPW